MLRPLVLLLLLTACAGTRPAPLPLASPPPREETLTLSTLLSEPQRWSGRTITLITPVVLAEQVLTVLPYRPEQPAAASIWLAELPPAGVRERLAGGAGYLELHGRLSPPGAYGRDQRYTYQFIADEQAALEPERTTVANLADNPRAIDGVLLTVDGTLLLRDDSALLVDRVSAGGVPQADARQIKLPRAAVAPDALSGLERSGDISWGPVRVTGWWENAAMAPFAIEPGRN